MITDAPVEPLVATLESELKGAGHGAEALKGDKTARVIKQDPPSPSLSLSVFALMA